MSNGLDIGRGEMIDKTNNVYQADQTRDALAKGLYSRLFDYLVQVRTNKIVLRYKSKVSYKIKFGYTNAFDELFLSGVFLLFNNISRR